MKSKSRNSLFLLSLFVLLPALTSCGFVHPGLLHTQADFDRMKAKVAAKISPWIEGYGQLTGVVQLGYGPRPVSWVSRGKTYCIGDNGGLLWRDVHNAYQSALIWKITGNTTYANKAVAIMNAWSYTLTTIGCDAGPGWDWVLMAGIQGYQFANVGEIMRNYTGWNQTDFQAFQSMMLNLFYPINTGTLKKFALTSYANWPLCTVASVLAIGVLTDNQTIFNEGVDYLKTGYSNGALAKSIYFIHPGYLGQGQK